jgi:hypothetical protein
MLVEEYSGRLGPVVEAVRFWTERTDKQWSSATTEAQVEILLSESSRLATLCTATSGVEPDYLFRDAHAGWVSALEARQAWASEVAHSLACCATASTAPLNALREHTSRRLSEAAEGLRAVAAGHGVAFGSHGPYQVVNERLRVTVTVPEGWVVARNDTQVALVAGQSLQLEGPEGLGVDGAGLGTGVRIRRLRKQADWSLDGAVEQAKAALSALGDERARRTIELGGEQASELLLVAAQGGWVTRLVIASAGEFAYFIEMGCPPAFETACQTAFDDFSAGLELRAP